jgi:hypothetical protein
MIIDDLPAGAVLAPTVGSMTRCVGTGQALPGGNKDSQGTE